MTEGQGGSSINIKKMEDIGMRKSVVASDNINKNTKGKEKTMNCKLVVAREDVILKLKECAKSIDEDLQTAVYRMAGLYDTICDYDEAEIFIFALRKALVSIINKKRKQIDIAQILKKCLKKQCYNLDTFFKMNIGSKSDKVEVFNILNFYQDTYLKFFNRFINRQTSHNNFDYMFFKEYIEFAIECFSSRSFIEILYKDYGKDRVKNVLDSVDKVNKLNYNIIKYKDTIETEFESEIIQEEMERRMMFGLDNSMNYKEILKTVQKQNNLSDFDIDENGNLIYNKNEFFYKRCEELISVIEK